MGNKKITTTQMSMAFYDVERRRAKNKFFNQIDTLIDWVPIEKELKKVYRGGKKERGQKPTTGCLKKSTDN